MAPFSRPYRLVGDGGRGRFRISNYGTMKAAEKQIGRWFREYDAVALNEIDLFGHSKILKKFTRAEWAAGQKT